MMRLHKQIQMLNWKRSFVIIMNALDATYASPDRQRLNRTLLYLRLC